MADQIVFRVLGPLRVETGSGRVSIAAPKQRAVFATLLLHTNEVVGPERIVDAVWGHSPPASALHLVQVYVSQLRRGLHEAALAGRLHTEGSGYRLSVRDGELDSAVFHGLLDRGLGQLATGDAADAATTLAAALALWRGDVLPDVQLSDEAARRVARLEEQRLVATGGSIDARLVLGESSSLVPELERLVATHPLREELRAQLMLALYRSGRQADALAAYQEARATLVEQLGIEPSALLRELESSILRHDPELEIRRKDSRRADISQPPLPRRLTRKAATVALVLTATIVLGATLTLFGGSNAQTTSLLPRAVSIIDERSGATIASEHVGTAPGRLAYGAGGLWVGDLTDHTLSLLATPSLRRLRVIGLPDSPSTINTSGTVVWMGYGYSGRIGRYVVRTRTLTRSARPTPTAIGLAAIAPTERDIWIGLQDGAVIALDPVSLRVKAAAPSGRFSALAVAGHAVWGTGFGGNDVVQMNNRTARIEGKTPILGAAQALAAGQGSIWVATSNPDRLYRIDPATRQITSQTPLGVTPAGIAIGRHDIWVSSGLDGQLERIDPTRSELVQTIRLGRPILSLTADNAGHVYVASG